AGELDGRHFPGPRQLPDAGEEGEVRKDSQAAQDDRRSRAALERRQQAQHVAQQDQHRAPAQQEPGPPQVVAAGEDGHRQATAGRRQDAHGDPLARNEQVQGVGMGAQPSGDEGEQCGIEQREGCKPTKTHSAYLAFDLQQKVVRGRAPHQGAEGRAQPVHEPLDVLHTQVLGQQTELPPRRALDPHPSVELADVGRQPVRDLLRDGQGRDRQTTPSFRACLGSEIQAEYSVSTAGERKLVYCYKSNRMRMVQEMTDVRRSLFLGLCLLLAPLAPLRAVDAYVPMAANLPLGAATYRTLLIATNTGSANAAFNVTFLASGTNGTAGAPQPSSYGLSPDTTLRVYNAVPAGARGMLAVSGDAAIVVSARVEALAANGNVLASAQVPVVTAAKAFNAGQHTQLQGLQAANGGAVTDLGLMNLSTTAANCTVQSFRTDGGKIANAASLTLAPRSNNDFTGALARLGQTAIKDARFDITCDQTFGTYALIYRPGGPETVVLGPGTVLDSELKPDGGGGNGGDGSVLFSLPGQFANGSTFAGFDLPLADGAHYGHARMELDLLLDHWHQVFPFNPNFHTVASFRRSADRRTDRVLYWGLILKGTGDYNTILDMG